jgi:hypothetical protein
VKRRDDRVDVMPGFRLFILKAVHIEELWFILILLTLIVLVLIVKPSEPHEESYGLFIIEEDALRIKAFILILWGTCLKHEDFSADKREVIETSLLVSRLHHNLLENGRVPLLDQVDDDCKNHSILEVLRGTGKHTVRVL